MNTMNALIRDYVRASNGHDYQAVTALFSSEATVEDESRTCRGKDEIQQWARTTQEEYGFTLEPLEFTAHGESTSVLCRVSGAFAGSPVDLSFLFTAEGDKIGALKISG